MQRTELMIAVALGAVSSLAIGDDLDLAQFTGAASWIIPPELQAQYTNAGMSDLDSTGASHAGQTDAGLLDNAGRGPVVVGTASSFMSAEATVVDGHVRRIDGTLSFSTTVSSDFPFDDVTLSFAIAMDVAFELFEETDYEFVFTGDVANPDLSFFFGEVDDAGFINNTIFATSGTLQPGRYGFDMDVFSPFALGEVPPGTVDTPVTFEMGYTLFVPAPATIACLGLGAVLATRRRR